MSTEIMICGQFPSLAITFRRSIVSALPTTSSNVCGLYFSTLDQDVGHLVPKYAEALTKVIHMQ